MAFTHTSSNTITFIQLLHFSLVALRDVVATKKQAHHGGFLLVAAGCDCVPAAPAVVILSFGGGLVDVDATPDAV